MEEEELTNIKNPTIIHPIGIFMIIIGLIFLFWIMISGLWWVYARVGISLELIFPMFSVLSIICGIAIIKKKNLGIIFTVITSILIVIEVIRSIMLYGKVESFITIVAVIYLVMTVYLLISKNVKASFN